MNAPQQLNAMGYTGGASESSLLALDATYQNNRNALEANRNDTLGQIRQNANQIQTSGNADLAELSANYYNQMAQAQAQSQARAQEQSNLDRNYQLKQQESEKSDFLNSIGAYSNDYMAQYNKVRDDGDASNDWQLPYLQQARNGKLSDIATQQVVSQQGTYNPVGTPTRDDTAIDMAKVNNVMSGFTSYAMSGNIDFIAKQTYAKYQAGQLTKAEVNYIFDGFNLPPLD